MSKKKGGKKNQNLDDFEDESKPAKDAQPVVKPGKVKSKKGKNKKDDDWSDDEKTAVELSSTTALDKESTKAAAKAAAAPPKKGKAKRGRGKNDGDWSDNDEKGFNMNVIQLDWNVKDVSDEDLVVGPVTRGQKKREFCVNLYVRLIF